MKTIAVRVSDDDHKLFAAVAAREDMPVSSLIRRLMRGLAREHALLVDAHMPEPAPPAPPAPKRRVIPMDADGRHADSFAWGAAIEQALQSGETVASIAASYGLSVDAIKNKLKQYRVEKDEELAMQNRRRSTPVQPSYPSAAKLPTLGEPIFDEPAPAPESELVYDPVDPDNPTEEEQAIHAEIARRKLLAMGFTL